MSRMIGLIAILIGFIISMTGIGALIGFPLMVIGFILLLPELFVPIIVLGIIGIAFILL